jgi:hypothetical protein
MLTGSSISNTGVVKLLRSWDTKKRCEEIVERKQRRNK